jgi:hypothetical protein
MTFCCGRGPRLVALLVAAVVCGDVTLDVACDPLGFPGPTSAAAAVSAETANGDACAESCVPDCFCCSCSETAVPALVLPGLTALSQAPSPGPVSVAAVVGAVPEPPPLALS